jgi:hypothetical protein
LCRGAFVSLTAVDKLLHEVNQQKIKRPDQRAAKGTSKEAYLFINPLKLLAYLPTEEEDDLVSIR